MFAHVGSGVLEPVQLLPAFVALGAYALRVRTLRRQGRPPPAWRIACFGAGIALILAALVAPVAHLGEELILAHMAQHVLMADLAALLLVLGLTGPLLQPLLATRVFRRLRVLANPIVAFSLWAIDLYVWHLPVLYQGALSSPPLHALQHASFLFFGFTMWLALLGPLPQPAWFGNGARLLYIVAVRMTGAVLGNVFLWSESVFYPDYRAGQAIWDIVAAQGPGHGGLDHDDREQHRHGAAAGLAVRQDRARVRGAPGAARAGPGAGPGAGRAARRPGGRVGSFRRAAPPPRARAGGLIRAAAPGVPF